MTAAAALLLAAIAAAQPSSIRGVVRDPSGMPVPGAAIVVRTASGGEQRTVSGPDGRFAAAVSTAGDILLIVRLEGFAEQRRALAAGAARQDVEIVLTPATLAETVTVTAGRLEQKTVDVAASVSILGREAIRRSPAVVADDLFRQVPTFSLFRRTSSLAAHPTAQGVSLRGIGPSGVSRTLVLLDGLPFNDAFGGWVYWTRVPLESVDRVEIVEGASSSLYGNYAMGGVVNIVTKAPAPRSLEVRTQYGSRNSPKVDFAASDVWGRLRATLDGSVFDTDGYAPVLAGERGRVDTRASVAFRNLSLKLQYDVTDRVHAFFRGGYFREERDNGKSSTIDGTPEANDTKWASGGGGVRIRMPGESDLQVGLFGDSTRFHSNFLAVPAATPPRSLGRMTLNQFVPAASVGGLVQWSRGIGTRQFLTAGMDWRRVEGESREDGLDTVTGTQVTLKRMSGGTQRSLGLFVQDIVTPASRLTLTFGARVDRWRNYDAHNLEASVPSGAPTANNRPSLPDRSDTVVSPRAAALYRVSEQVSVWGDIAAGFRAPTLNELYRQFRVGTVLTLANDQLGPERLLGGNLGVRVAPTANLLWRTTWFANRVKDPVSNVTLTQSGVNVTQQRQNLGRTRIRGVQTDVEYRIGPSWSVSGAYLYNDARVREFAANSALVGKFLPQVPRHRGSLGVSYASRRLLNFSVALEAVGRQFDDDQNIRAVPGRTEAGLPKYALLSFMASRALGSHFEVFVGAQNLFDEEYIVGTLPTTVGTPRLVSGGLRVRLSGR